MSKNIQNYFTTGELSQLCKIPRKTLLYYDKLGLITPELVDENGYRYYKRSQLFLLQLIFTLRQLDVPIARIKDYLANRSPQNYRDLFNERIDFFTLEIARLQAMKTELQRELSKLDYMADITLDKITLVHKKAHYLYLSNPTEEDECFKKRSSHIARMFTHLQKDTALTTNSFVYIYDAAILQDFATKHLKHYFYTLHDKLDTPHCLQKPVCALPSASSADSIGHFFSHKPQPMHWFLSTRMRSTNGSLQPMACISPCAAPTGHQKLQ